MACAVSTSSNACCSRSHAKTKRAVTNGFATFSKPSWLTTSKSGLQRTSSPTTNNLRTRMSAHTAQTELKLIGKYILEGEMHCETGLHIGAGKGSLEIGGAD